MLEQQSIKNNLEIAIEQLISEFLNKTFLQEREFYLNDNKNDRANGYLPDRNIKYGTEDINISIPRTRKGFYPNSINKYQKAVNDDYLDLLRKLILNCKNIKSLKLQAKSLGMPYKDEQIDQLLDELFLEAEQINQARLNSDCYFLYIDAKVIDLKFDDEQKVTKATHFTVVSVDTDTKKHIIYSKALKGNESLKLWREVLQNLQNRGLTRVSNIITDDFSGLTNLIKSLFPVSHHQLCMVHLLRNAHKRLDKKDYEYMQKSLQEINYASDYQSGYDSFIRLFDELQNRGYVSWSNYLRERIDNYSSYLHYPEKIQKNIRSTNSVEGINNDIEIHRRNSGGYFHSERDLMVKMRILVENKYNTKWKNPIPIFKANIYAIEQVFLKQFNTDI